MLPSITSSRRSYPAVECIDVLCANGLMSQETPVAKWGSASKGAAFRELRTALQGGQWSSRPFFTHNKVLSSSEGRSHDARGNRISCRPELPTCSLTPVECLHCCGRVI